mgnify:FL=1|jgi:hypothetical protein
MNIQKITTYVAAIFGVLGLVLLFMIINTGDDDIKMAALQGDYGVVSPFITLALIILVVIVLVTLVFSLLNLASHPEKLKRAGISIGLFAAVLLVAFFLSEGVETPMKDGEVLSAFGSRCVETGLRTFYFLVVIAIGSMLFSGVKKLIKK